MSLRNITVTVTGTLAKIEAKTSASGTTFVNSSVVTSQYNQQNNAWEDVFWNFTAFGKNAEALSSKAIPGCPVTITGTPQQRKGQNGVTYYDIAANSVVLDYGYIAAKNKQQGQTVAPQQSQQQQTGQATYEQMPVPQNIEAEGLPFM